MHGTEVQIIEGSIGTGNQYQKPSGRLSMDFKGPLPSISHNNKRVPRFFYFAFACPNISTSVIVNCRCQLFSLFSIKSHIYTDRGSPFMSEGMNNFLRNESIKTSRTSPYNPQGNGYVERLNGTLWKANWSSSPETWKFLNGIKFLMRFAVFSPYI